MTVHESHFCTATAGGRGPAGTGEGYTADTVRNEVVGNSSPQHALSSEADSSRREMKRHALRMAHRFVSLISHVTCPRTGTYFARFN